MDDKTWREKVYGPYTDAWKIIKILQDAKDNEALDELLQKYIAKVDEYDAAYQGNEFAELLRKKVLLRADDIIIGHMNKGE